MNQGRKQKRVQRAPEKIEESLSYTVEVRDKEGRVLQRISAPSRSYVEQWNQLINLQATQATKTVKDTDGVDQACEPDSNTLKAYAPIGVTAHGIRVGKGTTAVAIDDYALEIPSAEGVGVDQFNHQGMIFSLPAVAAPSCSFTARRTMINNSGATITGVREIGCYIRAENGSALSFLGFRDVLGSGCDVPDGGAITVEYTIGVTV
ncbi:hypothetical protein ES705_08034 [subsurface metagenome]